MKRRLTLIEITLILRDPISPGHTQAEIEADLRPLEGVGYEVRRIRRVLK